MTKAEFYELAERYCHGATTDKETRLVERFLDQVNAGKEPEWSLSEEEQTELLIWGRIRQSIRESQMTAGLIKRHIQLIWRIAASVVLVSALALMYWFISRDPEVSYLTRSVGAGEPAVFELPDGSLIHLNAQSSIVYPATFEQAAQREVLLTGEAFFEVKRDENKPFVIRSGTLTTTVLGTTFDIRAYPDQPEFTVTVASGKVQVASDKQKVLLEANDQVSYTRAGGTMERHQVTSNADWSWKDGILVLDNQPVVEAIRMLERRYGVEIALRDVQNATCRINGKYKNNNLVDILESLKFIYGITYEFTSDKKIVLAGQLCER